MKVITIDLEYVLWLFGFIASGYAVLKIWREFKRPNKELKETVAKHEEWLARDNERIKSIESLVISSWIAAGSMFRSSFAFFEISIFTDKDTTSFGKKM